MGLEWSMHTVDTLLHHKHSYFTGLLYFLAAGVLETLMVTPSLHWEWVAGGEVGQREFPSLALTAFFTQPGVENLKFYFGLHINRTPPSHSARETSSFFDYLNLTLFSISFTTKLSCLKHKHGRTYT